MIELEYVKKRKRKKVAAIVSGIAALGITALVIVSFLGRNVGTFTVSLNTGSVDLSLFNKMSSSESSSPTSFLRVDTLPPFEEYTYNDLIGNTEEEFTRKMEYLDNDQTHYLAGQNEIEDAETGEIFYTLSYFKYTFFVRNTGRSTARFQVKVIVKESTAAADGNRIENTLRVMLFDNTPTRADPNSGSHKYKVFAKKSEDKNTYYDAAGAHDTQREWIAYDTGKEEDLAYEFVDDKTIAALDPVYDFEPGDVKRYTLVTWLEGEDPQSNRDAPEGATLKLGVEINAYENKQTN